MTFEQLEAALRAAGDRTEAGELLAESLRDGAEGLVETQRKRPTEIQRLAILAAQVATQAAAAKWERAVKQAARVDESAPILTASEIGFVDGHDTLAVPAGWTAERGKISNAGIVVTYTPIFVLAELHDIESAQVSVELSWLNLGRWHRATVPRSTISDSRKIGALADAGVDVTSINASDMVRWLREWWMANRNALPRREVSGRCGWVRPGVFLRGEESHGGDVGLDVDGGSAAIAAGFGVRGDPDEWHALIDDQVAHRPLLLLALYASIAAPLLEIVRAPGFIVDWSGPSGRGKSTAMELAASVWGSPDALIQPWDTASTVAPQENAAFLRHLPLLMDDTKRAAGRERVISDMLYAIPDGRERSRGRKQGGTREPRRWRTIMLSTGEQQITSYAEGNAGAKRRALCLKGPPMGSISDEAAAAVRRIKTVCADSHGHAGAAFVDALCSSDPEAVRVRFAKLTAEYESRGVGSTDRSFGQAIAAIELASEIAARCGAIVVEAGDRLAAIDVAWRAAVAGGADSDEPLAALLELWSWCAANSARMYDMGTPAPQRLPPTMGWAGAWSFASDGSVSRWWVRPSVAHEVIDHSGRKSRYCSEEWARRGWLEMTSGGSPIKQLRGAYQIDRFYAFDLESVKPLIG